MLQLLCFHFLCPALRPTQNAAHGTYSALASVPTTTTASPSSALPLPAAAATGYARLNPPHQPQLTAAQQAAQAAITAGNNTAKRDGLVPVRTGLAWAPAGGSSSAVDPLLGGTSSLWGSAGFSATLDFGAGSSMAATGGGTGSGHVASAIASSATADVWSTWRSVGLAKLLKKAYSQQQRRQPSSGSAAVQPQQTVQAALQQMQAAIARSQEVLQQQLLLQLQAPLPAGSGDVALGTPVAADQLLLEAGSSSTAAAAGAAADGTASNSAAATASASALVAASTSMAAGTAAAAAQLLGGVDSSGLALAAAAAAITKPVVDSSNMDCLARRTDQLSFAAGEQDRGRLIKVVERLVEVGADLHLTDNEGRTALHLGE